MQLTAAFFGLVLLISAGLLVVSGMTARHYLRHQLRRRLMAEAAAGALLVNGDQLARIKTRADEESAAYKQIRERLQSLRDSTPGIRYVYTMRPYPNVVTWSFIVDAEEDPELVSHVGETYDTSSAPEMKLGLEGPAADLELGWDKWGCWLSGYAPIKDRRGRSVAIIGLDMSAAEVIRQERAILVAVVIWLIILLPSSALLAYRLAGLFSEPISLLAAATRTVAQGELTTEVQVGGSKEMMQLGESFNIMTRSLRAHEEQMLELSNTDFLTSLRNHRYFQERLEEEMNRAVRFRRPLSVVMIDLDDFRLINAQHGHHGGDDLLGQVAGLIKKTVRDCDIPTRFGGEEFAVIMPETTKDDAYEVAERVRQAIEGHFFVAGSLNSEAVVTLTASLGVAEFPTDSVEREGLVMAADLALLQAKHISRNRVCRYWRLSGQDSTPDPAQLHRALQNGSLAAVESLAEALDARDPYTRGHSENVTRLAVAVAKTMGLPAEVLEHLRLSGLLHDVGKIGVPDNILKKEGALTREERELIRAHPSLSAAILQKVPILSDLVPTVLSHHEHWDGSGYPHGLAGEQIPLPARILAVADVYDALTSHRPYREAMSREQALAEISSNAGKLFDSKVVAAFQEMIAHLEREELDLAGIASLA